MKVITRDRVRPFVWIKDLWDSWEGAPEYHEIDDFAWWGPQLGKVVTSAVLAYDVLPFLNCVGFMDGEA